MVQPKRCYMPPASDGKCPTTKREWYSEGLGNKRIQFFLSIGIFPFSTRGFSEGLKCRISPEIRIERVLRNERIVRETEFMRSMEPPNCVLGLLRHCIDGGHVETIAAICPISFFVRFKPGVDAERPSLADT